MRLFNNITYKTVYPYQGMPATLTLKNGKQYTGRVVEVRQDGILFHSSNPGYLFLPFAAVALLALSFGAGYGVGRAAQPNYAAYYGYPTPYSYRYY